MIDIRQAFAEEPPPLDFVLPGLLAGTVGAIVAPGGAGKSMLALKLAILVATGHDLAGIGGTGTTGPVAFLAAEDPAPALVHRLHAIGKHLNPGQREQVAESMLIEPLLGRTLDVTNPEDRPGIEAFAQGRRLLFLDTLRRFHQGDENDSGAMAALLGALEGIAHRTGCTIVFLHHASKAAALAGQGDMQQASRGSSVLTDNIRWQMFLVGATKDEAKEMQIDEARRGFFVRSGVSKQNYGKPTEDHWMMRTEGGVLVPAEFSTTGLTTKKRGKNREEA